MIKRLLLTIMTTASLTGLYALYAVSIRQVVVIPDHLQEDPAETHVESKSHRPAENVRVANEYLTDEDRQWATESRYMYRDGTGTAFLYTDNLIRQDGEFGVQAYPFAMIWTQKDKQGREQATSIVCKSAQLQFASAFDEKNPNPGRVVRAVFDGVQVKGPNGLSVDGDRFVFDEAALSIVSTEPVRFQFDKHIGRGRSLHMSLIPGDGLPGKDRPNVYGIRSIRLSSGTDLTTKQLQKVALDVHVLERGQPSTLFVRCSGHLEYDVAARHAQFSTKVLAYQKTGSGEYDLLEAERLNLQFEPRRASRSSVQPAGGKSQSATEGPVEDSRVVAISGLRDEYQKIDTDLEFRSLVATGSEAGKVKITSKRHRVKGNMSKLTYDVGERLLTMSDPVSIHVMRDGVTLTVPSVQVRLREEAVSQTSAPSTDSANSPQPAIAPTDRKQPSQDVEEILCLGPGRVEVLRPQTRELAFIATWEKHLRKSTDPVSGLDLVELDQQSTFRQPDRHTGLAAELIRIWLSPTPLNVDRPLSTPGTASALGSSPEGTSTPGIEPEPKRIVALRDVAFVSPRLEGRTNELDIRFEDDFRGDHPDDETAIRGVSQSPFRQRGRLVNVTAIVGESRTAPTRLPSVTTLRLPSRTHSLKQRSRSEIVPTFFASIPDEQFGETRASAIGSASIVNSLAEATTQTVRKDTAAETSPAKIPIEPIDATADRIGVKLRRVPGKKDYEVTEVRAEGRVDIRQKHGEGQPPLHAEGDRMVFVNHSESQRVLHVYGRPAILRDRGIRIEGLDVHADTAANRTWVTGAGLLQLPVPPETLRQLGHQSQDGDLDVWWNEKMEFDGQTAKFVGKVRAELGLSRVSCEQMDVTLNEPIEFAELLREGTRWKSNQIAISQIHCRENVTFANSEYRANRLVSVRGGSIAEIIYHHATGAMEAQGPGYLEQWQREGESQKSSAESSPTANRELVLSNRPISVPATEWNYTRVNFKGRMTGNVDDQRGNFHESVCIVRGPVKLPTDRIDRDKLPPKGGILRCDTAEVANRSGSTSSSKATGGAKGYLTFRGIGDAKIEGDGYYATADEISFDGSKKLFTLRAYGNESATVVQDGSNGKRNSASGKRIQFNAEQKSLSVDGITGVSGGH